MKNWIRKFAPYIFAAFIGSGVGYLVTPQKAEAQTCNIGGYVGAVQLTNSQTGLLFTIPSSGAHYRPFIGTWALLYSDGTFQVLSTKIDGTGPAVAYVRAHAQDLDSSSQQ